jgi:hypothetical protein
MFLARGQIEYHGDDVAAGIQLYQASLLGGEESKVAGTGRARITHITVFSADHRRLNDAGISLISYGDDMAVEFDVDFDTDVDEALIIINLLDQAGVAVAQCNSADQGFSVRNCGAPVRICMSFPQVPLNPGVYRLWIIVRDRLRPEPLAVYYGVVPFQVVGHFVGYIAFQPRVKWDLRVRK